MFNATETVTEKRSQFDPQLLIALSGLLDNFPNMKNFCKRYTANLFTVLSLSMIQQLDREIGGNQDLLSEGVQFAELVDQMSLFFSTPGTKSYVDEVVDRLVKLRAIHYDTTSSIAASTMSEFFVGSGEDLRSALIKNPVLLGFYLYVLVSRSVNYVDKSK